MRGFNIRLSSGLGLRFLGAASLVEGSSAGLQGGLQGHCERIGVAVSAHRVLITFVGATMQWRSPVRPIPSCSIL